MSILCTVGFSFTWLLCKIKGYDVILYFNEGKYLIPNSINHYLWINHDYAGDNYHMNLYFMICFLLHLLPCHLLSILLLHLLSTLLRLLTILLLLCLLSILLEHHLFFVYCFSCINKLGASSINLLLDNFFRQELLTQELLCKKVYIKILINLQF